MEFETLTSDHTLALLAFERDNKTWFESLIVPRPEEFYSESGVHRHIESLVKQMTEGKGYSGVLFDENGNIVARANLKDVEQGSGFVGYRVAHNSTSKGCASFCLSKLIEIAKSELALSKLSAQVLENNPGSARVLEKFGFQLVSNIPNFTRLNNKRLSCNNFQLFLQK